MVHEQLLNQLNSFHPEKRNAALLSLSKIIPKQKQNGNVNLHFHTFFSYNAEGWSPSRIAYESKIRGLYATGIIDFDVLDGQQEFFDACDILQLRTNVGIETRTYITEFADKEIDSPGEPGVSYVAGTGFVQQKNSEQEKMLAHYRNTAINRNKALIKRINSHIPEICIDYEKDVLLLTPSGNATERHIITSYINKSYKTLPDEISLCKFWSEILNLKIDETKNIVQNRPVLEEKVRAKLAKRGGLGYVQPGPDTFPKVEEFFTWVRSCGAIPTESWLDGTSQGEKDPVALLELSQSKGALALNIIPDRNWNIKNEKEKKAKLKNLRKIIDAADSFYMPIQIGTEMNKKGLPFVDDLDGYELNEFKERIQKGAKIITGHTLLSRYSDFSYVSDKAKNQFATAKEKNNFFEKAGELPPLNKYQRGSLLELDENRRFSIIAGSAINGHWEI